MWYWRDSGDGWGVFWMMLMMAFMWVPLILLLVWSLRQFGQPPRDREPPAPPPAESDAREIARRAYARGEIERERYLQIIQDLEQTKG